ncbi:hypothetical protein FGO68_gene11333 [Halteria grandinella]|uniref:Uncharacterized protein n=1 Tax=Halteria grandinella TaxID=5974 RepID=A0A8J8P3Y9_HALGN|nr:hypothetical protein FGO68_gene11333 [Halteria grandinella]
MAENSNRAVVLDSRATSFKEFCDLMTTFAENQLDFHRPTYYSLSKEVYKRIMDCYSQPRMTNEETDTCAARYRSFMSTKQEELQKSLMAKCKGLEICTDSCKNEGDMECLNKCGGKYLKELHGDFEQRLGRFNREINRMQ